MYTYFANANVAGNAYSDAALLSAYARLATQLAEAGKPDQSFECYAEMTDRIMGGAPMTWEEFERTLALGNEIGFPC